MREYLDSAGLEYAEKPSPLFRTAVRRTRRLSKNGMTANDMSRMVKRRLKDVGLPDRLSPHSFRVTAITDLLNQGVSLGEVQNLAGHADPRTTDFMIVATGESRETSWNEYQSKTVLDQGAEENPWPDRSSQG